MLDKKIILALGVSAAAAIAGGLYLTTDIFQPPEKKAKNAVAYRNAEPASRSSPHILKKEVTPEKKEVLPPSKETFSAGTLAELTGLQADRDLSKMAVELKGYHTCPSTPNSPPTPTITWWMPTRRGIPTASRPLFNRYLFT